jgi:hypothetical protein
MEPSRTAGASRTAGQARTSRATRQARSSGTPGTSRNFRGLLLNTPYGPIYLGSPTVITQTNPVSTAGLYYVSASAMVAIDRGDAGIFCYDTTANTGIQSQYAGSYSVGEIQTLSITDALNLGAGDSAEMVCYGILADNGSYVNKAGLTATLIHSGSVRLMAGKHSHAPSDSVERPK